MEVSETVVEKHISLEQQQETSDMHIMSGCVQRNTDTCYTELSWSFTELDKICPLKNFLELSTIFMSLEKASFSPHSVCYLP